MLHANSKKLGRAPMIAALAAVLLVAVLVVMGMSSEVGAAASKGSLSNAAGKIEPRTLQDTARGQSASFIVVMSSQADLSAAYEMKDEGARGWYVYNTLRAYADRTQADVRAQLVSRGIAYKELWIANALVVTGNRDLVEGLAARDDVGKLEANDSFKGIEPIVSPGAAGQDSPETAEWGVQNVRAPQVWALGYNGQNIVVGDGDTGMQWDHLALKPHYRGWNGTTANHNFNWWDAIRTSGTGGSCGNSTNVPCDDSGHGTHTTGTTIGDDGAGNQIGVAPGAKWIGCRNMDQGNGTPATYTTCFQFFLAPTDLNGNNPNPALRPHVENDSWGCPASEGCAPTTLQASVEASQAAGIFIEASAGNSGPGCSTVSDPPSLFAASFSTGAIDINNTLANFSSRGPVTSDGSSRMKPNIVAPGVSVRSAYPTNSYVTISGTSMAGPHVVGVVALLWSAKPFLARQITDTKTLLEQSANHGVTLSPVQTCGSIPSSQVPNNSFGWGRVDALAALSQSQTLLGHVVWQGPHAQPNPAQQLPITLTLKTGANQTDYLSRPTDANGYFTSTVGTLPAGGYTWWVKGAKYLANSGTFALAVTPATTIDMGLMKVGDSNGDNTVDVSDFGILRASFGKSQGNPGYDDRADLNGDHTVDLNDFGLMRANFGQTGAPLP